jgi:HEPN domain-containing protein
MGQAEKDLEVAGKNFELGEWYVVAFFCQQAAEKALKAVYIKKFNELARVHDLVFLGRKVGLPKGLLDGCGYLNRAYTESRYPGEQGMPADKFSREDADRCIIISGEVLEWTKKTL